MAPYREVEDGAARAALGRLRQEPQPLRLHEESKGETMLATAKTCHRLPLNSRNKGG